MAVALAAMAGFTLPTQAQLRTISLHLKPRQPQTVALTLQTDRVAILHLRLDGGIVGVRETTAAGNSRPLWLIDLGRGANLTYVVTGTPLASCDFEVTSFERERQAEVSIEIDQPVPQSNSSASLLKAEDLLANAELLRRHWPGAPSGENALTLYENALALAAGLNDVSLQR